MASIVQFTVTDTSPTVSYSPSDDWSPCFTDIGCLNQWQAPNPIPNGISYHLANKTGASFTLNWRGTGVKLMGTASINYTVHLDDKQVPVNPSGNVLASIQNASLDNHNVTLTVGHHNSSQMSHFNVSYTGAMIYVDDTAAGSTVSLNKSAINYTGSWSDYGQFKHSNATGDVANTTVQGLSFFLYGMTNSLSGSYSVTLSALNDTTATSRFIANYSSTTLSANTSYRNSDALLYYASDLDPTLFYNVIITNQDGSDLYIRSDGFEVFQLQPKSLPTATPAASSVTSSKISTSTAAAIALGLVLFLLFAALVLFYIFVYRPRNRRCREESDAIRADKAKAEDERMKNPVMRLEEARISQSSSYRQRLARIISIIAPAELSKRPSWKTESQHLQPLSPLSPASTSKSDYILDISPRVSEKPDDRRLGDSTRYNNQPSTEEGGTIFVHVPTSTLESEPDKSDPSSPANPRGEENSLVLQHRPKSSPDATIPVSPSISSGVGTQSQSRGRGSQNSSQPRSGRFSFPFSVSIPYVRTRSLTEDGNGDARNGRRSRIDLRRRLDSANGGDGPGSDDTSLSTIVFAAAPKVPSPPDKTKEKMWDIRKSVRSFMNTLSGVGRRWHNSRASARAGDVIYPFVGVSSSAPPQRALSAGGLLVIGRDRRRSFGAGDTESPRTDRREENGTQGTQRTPLTGTDITPLSYVTHSDDAFPAGEVGAPSEEGPVDESGQSSPAQPPTSSQPGSPFSSHPYAAAALFSGPDGQSSTNVAEGSRQRPQTTPAPARVGFRQLPIIPRAPPAAHSVSSRPRPHTESGTASTQPSTRITPTTSGRPIRALPPLPVPSTSQPTDQAASSSSDEAKESPLITGPSVQDDTASSLPPPYPSSAHSKRSQRASSGTQSTKSSLKLPFLTMRQISPFQVNFPGTDDERSLNEGETKPTAGPSTARARPTLTIASSTDADHRPSAAITPRTARSTAQYSFLDFATNSSSSNKTGSTREKSEQSPISDVGSRPPNVPPLPILPAQTLDESSRAEEDLDDHSRRTFGQKRRRSSGSFYYNPADNPSVPSPSTSSFTHQSHLTHQSYQTAQSQDGQRLSTQSSQRRHQHVSWRGTFGGARIEMDIPEEATPSDTSPPFSIPTRTSLMDPATSQSPPPRASPSGLEPGDQARRDATQSDARRSYISASSVGPAAHIHPFSAQFNNSPPSRLQYTSQAQTEPVSPESADDISVSSPIQFRAGGIRRTSSGDVQPVSSGYRRPTHTRDGGSSSGGSGDLQPRHPFSIP